MEKDTRNIYQRLNAVMKEVEYMRKDSTNEFQKYKYVSHDAVVGTLRLPIANQGIQVIPDIISYGVVNENMMEMKLSVKFVNIDNPQDFVITNAISLSSLKNEKTDKIKNIDEKIFGTMYSYTFKYALLKFFMIETGLDADAESEQIKETEEKKPQKIVTLGDEEVQTILKHAGEDKERVNKILDFYNAKSLKEIPYNNYNKILSHLTKPKPQAKRVTA